MTWTLLHEDCERQVEDAVVTRCRSHPEETNLVDEHGLTPLHLLCFSNPSIKALSSLLKANPEVLLKKDRHGDLPIHVALRNNEVEVDAITLLINSCPSSLTISNNEGLMPLHIACRHCSKRADLIHVLASAYPNACYSHIKSGELVKKSTINTRSGTKSSEQSTKTKSQNHFIADGNVHHPKQRTIDLQFHEYDTQIRDGSYPLHMAILNNASYEVIHQLVSIGGRKTLLLQNKLGKTSFDLVQEREDGVNNDYKKKDEMHFLLNPDKDISI